MTDYDAMTDEELAVLVAERVMGWTWDGDLSAWVSVIDEGGDVRWHCDRLTWAPATQWSDAGRVLEKMREGGWWYAIVCAPPRSDFGVMVVFAKGAVTACAQCPSELRAFNIAALKAVDA